MLGAEFRHKPNNLVTDDGTNQAMREDSAKDVYLAWIFPLPWRQLDRRLGQHGQYGDQAVAKRLVLFWAVELLVTLAQRPPVTSRMAPAV